MKRSYFLDRVLLVITAIIIGALAFTGTMLLDNSGLSDGWIHFVLGCFIYIFISSYMFSTSKIIRGKWKDFKVIFAVAASVIGPVVISFMLFYYGTIKLPETLFPYMIGGILLSPLTTTFLEQFLRNDRSN